MKCENCGVNNATTHIKKVINGVVTEQYLCQSCYAKKGYGANSLAGMLASVFGDTTNEFLSPTAKKCDECGCTFSDIVNFGKVGCSKCYETFYDELLPYLKRIHSSITHVGKIPNRAPLSILDTKNELETLRSRLNDAVLKEEFEVAAELRDKIREIERKEDENE
ncbi:MAG: hypothetical protein E7531_04725 [Ruminococcaceae bacterium]|nr:hypothetical protein [Oscillospiraceae bacterium]